MTLYEIMDQLARHQLHINHVKQEVEALFDQEPQNDTLRGFIGYLEHRSATLGASRNRIESLQDYPGSELEQALHPSQVAQNAVKSALEQKTDTP